MEVKISFWADIDESDFDIVKRVLGKCGAEIIGEEFPELKNIGYFNMEKADDSPRITHTIPEGQFMVDVSSDPEYPGIDVEFVPHNESENHLSQPRVLLEWPKEEDSKLRALIWADPNSEDYTDKIEFDV